MNAICARCGHSELLHNDDLESYRACVFVQAGGDPCVCASFVGELTVENISTWEPPSLPYVYCISCGERSPSQELPSPWCGRCVHEPRFKEYWRRLLAALGLEKKG